MIFKIVVIYEYNKDKFFILENSLVFNLGFIKNIIEKEMKDLKLL